MYFLLEKVDFHCQVSTPAPFPPPFLQMSPGSCSTVMASGLLPWHRAVQLLWRMKVQPGDENRHWNLKAEKERWVYNRSIIHIPYYLEKSVIHFFINEFVKHGMRWWMYIKNWQDICWSGWKNHAGFYIGDLVDLSWCGCLRSSLGSFTTPESRNSWSFQSHEREVDG